MVLKTHLEPFREPLKVPPVGQPKNPADKGYVTKIDCVFPLKIGGYHSPNFTGQTHGATRRTPMIFGSGIKVDQCEPRGHA